MTQGFADSATVAGKVVNLIWCFARRAIRRRARASDQMRLRIENLSEEYVRECLWRESVDGPRPVHIELRTLTEVIHLGLHMFEREILKEFYRHTGRSTND